MKTIALALALAISAVQTVGWVECCCVLICKHQSKTCGECEEKAQAPAPDSCCEKEKTDHAGAIPHKGEGGCSHVQPSSEVASHGDPLPPVVFAVVLELPVVPFQPSPEKGDDIDGAFRHPRGSPPLHLLYSVLLI